MNAREGLDIAKMAITCMLVTLVLGAAFGVWYLCYQPMSDVQRSMTQATNTSATERLRDLQDQSESADKATDPDDIETGHPLVTSVANILSEYDDDSLLYVYIVNIGAGSPKDGQLYTYEGVAVNTLANNDVDANGNMLPGITTCTRYADSTVPVTQAVKSLLTYSQYRCHVHLQNTTYNGMQYTGVVVEVMGG